MRPSLKYLYAIGGFYLIKIKTAVFLSFFGSTHAKGEVPQNKVGPRLWDCRLYEDSEFELRCSCQFLGVNGKLVLLDFTLFYIIGLLGPKRRLFLEALFMWLLLLVTIIFIQIISSYQPLYSPVPFRESFWRAGWSNMDK